LPLRYLAKENTGPGKSRNYGMHNAAGNYFIILDSDCLVPPAYLRVVEDSLRQSYADCYGGPDAAHTSFTTIQKAINYAMTSMLTTGGIRGKKKGVGKFQPRSFNMGLSRKAFEVTGGFGDIHPGEDPDLSIRLWRAGLSTKLIPEAFVYHKRRIDFSKFYAQVKKFGLVRPILTRWYPETASITYWFPTIFCLGFLGALWCAILGIFWPLSIYGIYALLLVIDAGMQTRNMLVAGCAMIAVVMQFCGYGYGFLKSTILINFSNREPRVLFPQLFFQKD
jgi:GT2 family glycosyltransferase